MAIISLEFLLLVLLTCSLYYIVPGKLKWLVLLISSYVFYILSSFRLTIFIVLTSFAVYLATRRITSIDIELKSRKKEVDREQFKELKKIYNKRKKRTLLIALVLNFGVLAFFKYADFFSGNINSLLGLSGSSSKIPMLNLIMPLGISYYTLMAVSYVLDVYYGKYEADKNIGRVFLFLSFFPHITEGPLDRYDTLAYQLYKPHKFNYENFKYGVTLILAGLVKKMVLADRAALYVNEVFPRYSELGGFTLFMAAILYTFQIYAEFSGCMDIVSGISKMLGIDLAVNFRRPFFSRSIGEFWRRWHVTLGAWLRDYVFYPVSLSKMNMNVGKWARTKAKGIWASFIPAAFPLFFVWFGNGFWHGASWKYILYGLYYYIVMMIAMLCKPLTDKFIKKMKINVESVGYRLAQIIRTNLFVLFGMTLFRSHSTYDAISMTGRMFTTSGSGILDFGMNKIDFLILLIGLIVMFIVSYINEKGKDTYHLINNSNLVVKYAIYVVIIVAIIVLGIYGSEYKASDFIYGQF